MRTKCGNITVVANFVLSSCTNCGNTTVLEELNIVLIIYLFTYYSDSYYVKLSFSYNYK